MDNGKLMKQEKMVNETKGSIMLMGTSVIWGLAYIAQRKGMDHIGAFTFSAVRCLIAGICMVIVIRLLNNHNGRKIVRKADENPKDVVLGGFFCGLALFLGMGFQQLGVARTSIANSGFISALYIVIVPILGLFIHKKVKANIWVGIFVSLIGLALLCFEGTFKLNTGDIFMLCSATFYSLHIMCIDYFAPKVDGTKMSCIQFFVGAFFNVIAMFIFEEPTMKGILQAWLPLLYVGVLSTAVGYTLQIIGQKFVPPTIAAMLMSLESVFAGLFGWLILHETMSFQKFMGCVVVFSAIVIAQLPTEKIFKKKAKAEIQK